MYQYYHQYYIIDQDYQCNQYYIIDNNDYIPGSSVPGATRRDGAARSQKEAESWGYVYIYIYIYINRL